eukprot:155187-Prorocentrum_minimum.AAC.2
MRKHLSFLTSTKLWGVLPIPGNFFMKVSLRMPNKSLVVCRCRCAGFGAAGRENQARRENIPAI